MAICQTVGELHGDVMFFSIRHLGFLKIDFFKN